MTEPGIPPEGATWEAEVKAMSDRLAHESRRSGLIGFLGGAAVMGGLAIVIITAMHSKQALNVQLSTNQSLNSEVRAKTAQVTTAQQQAATAKTVLSATVENLQAQNAALSASATSALDQAFETDPNAAKLLVRVYIHVHTQPQRRGALKLAQALRAAGYLVPGIDVKPESVQQAEVHYYNSDSQSRTDAEGIAKVVTAAGIPCQTRQVPQSASDKLKPRAYGLWLAADL